MHIVRFQTPEGAKFGDLEGNVIKGISGSPFDQFTGPGSNFKLDGSTRKLGEVQLLSPCVPSKVVCVGSNHKSWGDPDDSSSQPPNQSHSSSNQSSNQSHGSSNQSSNQSFESSDQSLRSALTLNRRRFLHLSAFAIATPALFNFGNIFPKTALAQPPQSGNDDPLIFIKPTTAVIGPGENIVFDSYMKNVGFEGELGVVIGKKAKDVPREKAKEYILGYTCLNDVSNYEAIAEDEDSLTRAKGADTFAPLGPCIRTDIDYETTANLKLESFLNGQKFQTGFTRDLIVPVSELLSLISSVMTMLPGDVIGTGTPKKSDERMKNGDVIEIVIDGIGSLKNSVVQKEYKNPVIK